MKKRFKKIYVEIINFCNLACPFCVKTSRDKKMMTKEEFSYVLDEIKPYTDYIYLHVQGEPLMHPLIKDFLDIAYEKGFFVNITTNVTLLHNNLDILLKAKSLRQINLSLQAIMELNNKEKYYDDIVSLIKNNDHIYISLRIWGDYSPDVMKNELAYLEERLNIPIRIENKKRITDRVFLSLDQKFDWPDLNNPFNSESGRCEAIHQIAILSNGVVVPCCLDKDGIMNMGNIFETLFSDIINSNRYKEMIKGFKCGKVNEELCKHCTFLNRFNK